MSEETGFFQEDIYNFFGYEIRIKTNSQKILNHLQSAYNRYYLGNDIRVSEKEIGKSQEDKNLILITDNLSSSNEILVNGIADNYNLKCKSLYDFEDNYYSTVPDPLSFIQWIVLKNICLLAKDYQLIHAGAVSLDNECMIFPSLSGMGKTTLTLKLVLNGFKFLSDELACLHPGRMHVEPFYRKLNISDKTRNLLQLQPFPETCIRKIESGETEWTIDVEDIVPSSLSGPSLLRCIIFLQGFGEKPRLEYLSPSNALFKLFKFSFSSLGDRAKLLYNYAPLINSVNCFNLVIGDIDKTADLVGRLFDNPEGAVGKLEI